MDTRLGEARFLNTVGDAGKDQPDTEMARIDRLLSELDQQVSYAAERTMQKANMICGHGPQTGEAGNSKPQPRPVPEGLLNRIIDQLESALKATQSTHDHLSRLDRALGT